jgi:hypothetical protein
LSKPTANIWRCPHDICQIVELASQKMTRAGMVN